MARKISEMAAIGQERSLLQLLQPHPATGDEDTRVFWTVTTLDVARSQVQCTNVHLSTLKMTQVGDAGPGRGPKQQ